MTGSTILHYKILEKLGEGGMGVVYKAEDTKLKREVAIKFLPQYISGNEEERQRFEIEAQAAASLNHPNITTIYSIEEVDNEMFIVMEYIEGIELKDKIKAGPIPTDEAINIAIQIAEGLETAHKKGIIHRDIKSQNIMITKDGKVKIMDFGLAKVGEGAQVTKIGSTIGTIAYMSPEQARGEELDNRTDIFSYGIVLYEMIADFHPFKGDYDQAIIYSIINENPSPIKNYSPDVPSELSDIVFKCLRKNKEERYNSFGEIIKELQTFNQIKTVSIRKKDIETRDFIINSIPLKSDLFIGREKQLDILNKFFNKLKGGEGKTVFISGEPGIGKTQLVSYAIKNFTGTGFNILYGRCLFNNEGGIPYHPFVNAVKNNPAYDDYHFINIISMIASESGINISNRIPLIKSFLNLTEGNSNTLLHKEQLWDAVFILFKTIASEKPLILILDDIQWADKVSLGLFLFIARNIGNIPLALIGIHRPPETVFDFDMSSLVELTRQLSIEDLAETISLERLDEKNTYKIIKRLFNGQSVDKKLSSKIFRQSEGNPLFIYELVNLIRDKNLVKLENDTWKLIKEDETEFVTKKVQDVIKQRIDYLDNKVKEILEVASCEGEYFQSDILAGALNINKLELLKLLQSLENESHIIRYEKKSYRFDHILIREVLYDSIIPELREEYHKIIAKWLIENCGTKDEYASRIAHHLILANQEDKSIEYLLRAANRARDLYAVEEALDYYNRLLIISHKTGKVNTNYELETQEGLGDVNITLGKSEDALNHYNQYLNLARSGELQIHIIKALRKLAECNRVKGILDKADDQCNEALELAEKNNERNEVLESLNTLAFISASRGDYNKTIEISDRALNFADELNDQKNKSLGLSNLGFAYWHLGNYPLAMKRFTDSISIQRSIGDNRGLSTTLNFLGMAYWKVGKYEDALKCSHESVEIKNRIEDYRKIPGSLNVIGDIYRDLSDIKEAINYHKQSLTLATEHLNKGAMCDNLRDLGEDYFLLGDFDQALTYYKEVLELSASSHIKWYETRTYVSLSELYLSLGNLEEAKKNIETGLKYSYEIGAKDLIIEALWNQARIKAGENLPKESNKLFSEAIQIAKSVGHQTFLWKLLYDYSDYLYKTGNEDESKRIKENAKEIVLNIYSNLTDETLKNIFVSSQKIKELISFNEYQLKLK